MRFRRIKPLLWGGVFTPRGWAVRALLIIAAFGVLHLLGWRDDTRVISGTASADLSHDLTAVRGLVYAAAYFAAVVVSPILIIAAVAFSLFSPRRRAAGDEMRA